MHLFVFNSALQITNVEAGAETLLWKLAHHARHRFATVKAAEPFVKSQDTNLQPNYKKHAAPILKGGTEGSWKDCLIGMQN